MTREKAINLVMKVFDTLEGECNIEYDWREEHEARDMAIKALEQESVSRESYDHEYFLRKEHEVEIEKLRRLIRALERKESILDVLDKVRAEIVDLGQRTMNDNRASGIWACRDIIDKYKEREGKKWRRVILVDSDVWVWRERNLGNARCLEISRDSIYHGYMDGFVSIIESEE